MTSYQYYKISLKSNYCSVMHICVHHNGINDDILWLYGPSLLCKIAAWNTMGCVTFVQNALLNAENQRRIWKSYFILLICVCCGYKMFNECKHNIEKNATKMVYSENVIQDCAKSMWHWNLYANQIYMKKIYRKANLVNAFTWNAVWLHVRLCYIKVFALWSYAIQKIFFKQNSIQYYFDCNVNM